VQNFDYPNTIYGQVGKLIKHVPQHLFTTCPILHVSRLDPDREKNPILSDRHYRLKQRELLIELGIPDFIKQLQEPGYEYSKDTEAVVQIAALARARARDVKRDLGIKRMALRKPERPIK